jgi:hypothetical protein
MAAFLGDIAFLFGIVVAVAGLFTLHKAGADPRPELLKIAGIVLLVAGIGTALCTSYFYLKYHFAGDLEHPYSVVSGKISMMHGMDGKMMMEKMMDKRMKDKQPSMDIPDDESFESGDTTEEDHEAHHVD